MRIRSWEKLYQLSGLSISCFIHGIALVIMLIKVLPQCLGDSSLETQLVIQDAGDFVDLNSLEPLFPDTAQAPLEFPTLAPIPTVQSPQVQLGTSPWNGTGFMLSEPSAKISPEIGQGIAIFKKAAAQGGQSGPIQVTLAWEGPSDLDLHVVPPKGRKIYFVSKESACGGKLDVDMNSGFRANNSLEPVENIVWTDSASPRSGEYRVYVHHYHSRESKEPEVPFRVAVMVNGSITLYEGVVRRGQSPLAVLTFHYQSAHPEKTVVAAAEPPVNAGPPVSAERRANAKLRLAKQMLARDVIAGRERLEEIVAEFPDTEAARSARQLLEVK